MFRIDTLYDLSYFKFMVTSSIDQCMFYLGGSHEDLIGYSAAGG